MLGLTRMWRPAAQPEQELPSEIYISLVGSLFTDPRTLLVGAIGTISAVLITALKSAEPLLWLCAIAIAVTACVRAADMRIFGRQGQFAKDAKSHQEMGVPLRHRILRLCGPAGDMVSHSFCEELRP
jgi:hypothetical protein